MRAKKRFAYVLVAFSACAWHQRFDEPERWAREFEDPSRDAWQKPDEVIAALALKEDASVADLGAGTGYFSVRLARALPKGWVYGVDLEPAMTQYLEDRASREELGNLLTLTATEDSPQLPAAVDCVLIVDTFHHLEDRVNYFYRLRSWLSPGGTLAIIDFNAKSTIGPPPEHRLSPEQVTEELTRAGFTLAAHHDFLPNQYFLVFTVTPGPAPVEKS